MNLVYDEKIPEEHRAQCAKVELEYERQRVLLQQKLFDRSVSRRGSSIGGMSDIHSTFGPLF